MTNKLELVPEEVLIRLHNAIDDFITVTWQQQNEKKETSRLTQFQINQLQRAVGKSVEWMEAHSEQHSVADNYVVFMARLEICKNWIAKAISRLAEGNLMGEPNG